ncbi:site-specific DNA-methyltransferase [Duncaniella muris]|jgi:adenine-specific DNA-methyltransferase|uniref:site-specific DNA-methyltransferase n=1 Tax=Duncaniella muris TaxID=2094150 RepID=UPI0027357730|nr:site-specific DNA-methyltransferase [Duncaniella muris]
MDKLKMQSRDVVGGNVEKIAALFPHCVAERLNKDGKPELAIDFDKLRAELSNDALEDGEERYQFTWPDKRVASRLANEPVNLTLRPCREESVDFDTTENLYIEGDNLDVLKVLRETYLGRVKMIYIDPPYNTGNDFVYNDDFAQGKEDFEQNSGLFDAEGNQTIDPMQRNTEANGRFHTDWLNMIYPRLKVARDLLSEDGVIFISIDDNEVENLKKVCCEIFGERNFVSIINWKGRGGRQDSKYYAVLHEYILCFAKNIPQFSAGEEIKEGDIYPKYDEVAKRNYKTQLLRKWGSNSLRENRPNLYYSITAPDGTEVFPTIYSESKDSALGFVRIQGRWRHGASTLGKIIADGRVEFLKNKWGEWVPYEKIFEPRPGEENTKKFTTWVDDISNGTDTLKKLFGTPPFDYAKSPELVSLFLRMADVDSDDVVLDFFSGSATTAHAVMKLNAEDGGHRKFIMVQLPEVTDEKSEARKAGYANICEIGKERIRRAGKKVKEEAGQAADGLDTGFRVLKLDSSNMEDVFYTPDKFEPSLLDSLVDNIKADRSGEDLLFQVMLDLGIELSAKIERKEIAGKEVFSVDDDYLLACFDTDVNETTIEEMAKLLPTHLVIRDASAANDNVLDNFDQIIESYSNEKKITTHVL